MVSEVHAKAATLRKGDPTANVRMDCLTKETMDEYFKLIAKGDVELLWWE